MKKITLILSLIFITTTYTNATTPASRTKYSDGPYIKIINDTTILVQYISQDTIIEFSVFGNERFVFKGKGFDSLGSYNVSTQYQVPKLKTNLTSKLFVFSDIHGEFDNLCELLINNKIIDSNLYWSFGDGHLVIDGDMMDRGYKVTEILWMIYRLEQEAEKAGGGVHFLLGNHEMMVLQNDLRYIHDKYKSVAEYLDSDSLLSNLYSNQTVFGNWLRSKNIAEIINGMLFVHGGISPKMMHKGYSLAFINEKMRTNIGIPRESIKADSALKDLFGSFGPIWYRGYHYDMDKYSQASTIQIDSLLDYYDATNIIVGHTAKDSIAVLYDGKIFGVNQDYEVREEFKGLFIENGVFYACDINGVRRQIHKNK